MTEIIDYSWLVEGAEVYILSLLDPVVGEPLTGKIEGFLAPMPSSGALASGEIGPAERAIEEVFVLVDGAKYPRGFNPNDLAPANKYPRGFNPNDLAPVS